MGAQPFWGDVCCTRSADRGQFREENSPVGQSVSTFCLLLVHLTAWTQSFLLLLRSRGTRVVHSAPTAWTESPSLGCGLSVSENLPTSRPIKEGTGLEEVGGSAGRVRREP